MGDRGEWWVEATREDDSSRRDNRHAMTAVDAAVVRLFLERAGVIERRPLSLPLV